MTADWNAQKNAGHCPTFSLEIYDHRSEGVRPRINYPHGIGRIASIVMGYEETYRRSIEQPELFWAEEAKAI